MKFVMWGKLCVEILWNGGFVIALDQWTKWLVVKNMTLGERIIMWDPYLRLLSHRNRGAAWGMSTRTNVDFYHCHCYRHHWNYLLFP